MYKITLNDGTILDNLSLNGNNFVSQTALTENDFAGKLKQVIVYDYETETTQTLNNVELIQIAHYTDGYYFILRELSAYEIAQEKADAQIVYTAMMTDTLIGD